MNTAFTQPNHSLLFKQPSDQEQRDKEVRLAVQAQLQDSLLFNVSCVNCEEAATLLSVEPDTVRDWIKAGKLIASKVGREWIIRLRDVDTMLAKNSNIVPMDDKRFKTNRRKIS